MSSQFTDKELLDNFYAIANTETFLKKSHDLLKADQSILRMVFLHALCSEKHRKVLEKILREVKERGKVEE